MTKSHNHPADDPSAERREDLGLSGVVRYSTVWEDQQVLIDGLGIAPDDNVLSIASSGDNVFAMTIAGAGSVTAVDINEAQLALVELHMIAVSQLGYDDYIRFIGAAPSDDRESVYARMESALSERARRVFDSAPQDVSDGVIHCGRLERHFARARHEFNVELGLADAVERLLSVRSVAEQVDVLKNELVPGGFDSHMFEKFFSKAALASDARSERQLAYVEGDGVAQYLWNAFGRICCEQRLDCNPYVRFLLTGAYGDLEYGPLHLRRSGFETLRDRLDRIELVDADVVAAVRAKGPRHYTKANLSDIFEYLSVETGAEILSELAARMQPGGRIAWWSFLVDRRLPKSVFGVLADLPEEAGALHGRDRVAFLYRSFELAAVR